MIENFDDFCLWVYVTVDDVWLEPAPLFGRPGPAPECSDAELIAMTLIGECRGWHEETSMLSHFGELVHLFPVVPSQSRYNRRRRNLAEGFNLVRRAVLSMLDLAADRQCAIDSLPVPVVGFHLAPTASRGWAASGASFGKVASKKQTIYGYKLHLLVTLGGVILDFELAPANASELEAGEELLRGHAGLDAYGDKGYIGRPAQEALEAERGVRLHCVSRRNQKAQTPAAVRLLIDRARQIAETVNSQLAGQFGVESAGAHTLWGLRARLHSKLAAHTLCVYLNRSLGAMHPLRIKRLAFN
jgi:hypothetical protein